MNLVWAGYRMLAPVAGSLAPTAGLFLPALERALWDERLGRITVAPRPDAWVHAASLGEAVAARALVAELRSRSSRARVHLTATTRTGRERLREIDPAATLAPLDTPQAAARFFSGLRPRRLFLVETELWPQWLLRARVDRIPVVVASARLSRRSLQRYRWLGERFRELVAGLAGVLCQGHEDQARWLELGASADRTAVMGNLKIDALPGPAPDRDAARRQLALDPDRPLLVLGSLRPREAGVLARAWRSLPGELRDRWQVVAVPRHPGTSAALRAEASAAVTVTDGGAPAGGEWRWDARPGVLGAFYAAADAAFVGGSLLPYGGHNPLEPAACGAAVIVGPHHGAQAAAMKLLEAGGAVYVAAPEQLASVLRQVLEDDQDRGRRAVAGLEVVRAATGGARRTVDWLETHGLWSAP